MSRYHLTPGKAVIDTVEYRYYTVSEFKKVMKANIDAEYEYLKKKKKEQKNFTDNHLFPTDKGTLENLLPFAFFDYVIEHCERRIEDYAKLLKRCDFSKAEGTVDIERAKQVPFEEFVEVGRNGKMLCVWHDDKHPSLHYYKKQNKVWCFSCNSGGDLIDYIQQKHNVSLPEAVSMILHG